MISLTHFHSPITKQKLSLIKPSISNIPYSSYEEINSKFKDLCMESKSKFQTPQNSNNQLQEEKSINKTLTQTSPKPRIRRSSVSPNFQRKGTHRYSIKLDYDAIKETLGENNDITDMGQKVKEQYEKNIDMTLNGQINPVVKFFGSTIIASVFQALLIKSIEEVSLVKLDNDNVNSMSSKVLEYFGISPIQLKLMKTQEARKNYILKCMNSSIEKLLKSWKEKIEIQEKHYEQSSKEYENLKKRNKEELHDRFPWLDMKTKYVSLQKKLKALIIQKLNDYENQISVIQTLHKRDSMSKSMVKINYDELKVTFHDITPPKTSSLIYMGCKNEDPETPSHHSALIKKIRSQSGFKNASIDTRISTNSSVKYSKDKTSNNIMINKFFQSEMNNTVDLNIPSLKNKEIEWDEEFEGKFKHYMANGRKLFFNEMRNAKFYEIGVMYMIQELFKEEKKNLERTACLDSYAEGGYLTPEELKFLADTSDLLNSCVDKQYIKKVVNLIDPNILHYIELNLAESIISRYKEMRAIIVNARNKFIQKNNSVLKQKLNDFQTKIIKSREKTQLTKDRLHISKSIRSVIKKIQGNQEQYEENFKTNFLTQMKSPNKNIDIEKKFEEYNKCKPYKENSHKSKNYSQPKEIDLYCSPTHPKVIRHKYHPSSKVFFVNDVEKEEKNLKHIDLMKSDILKYKLQINSPESLKEKDTFIKFYSGGPSSQIYDEPLYKYPQRNPTPFEMKAILRLQRRGRGYIARKKFVEMKAQMDLNKFSNFLEKVKKFDPRSGSPRSPNIKNISSPTKLSRNASRIEQNFDELREFKIINKSPPKNLLLKHRKLLEGAKKNNIYMVRNSGFTFYPNDMNVRDKRGNVPLYYVTKHGNLEFCTYMIEKGAKVNEKCEGGNTPFHLAFSTNSIEIIMLMLDNNGNLNNANDKGQTPLAFASESTLKRLDLENAVATTTSSSLNFDNNKFLIGNSKKTTANDKFNEFCCFQLDKMVKPSDGVRIVDQQHKTHLISFPENVKTEETFEKVDEDLPKSRIIYKNNINNISLKR